MSLFGKKEKMELLKKTQENLEQSQKNMEALILMKTDKMNDISNYEENNITPMMAAYALNLCTVSVTQIIDYMDLNIMEQEYDMILNNLNLQNMPDDEALLDILKQILNTVTFFKIDQKEREFIERDYQQKMKNAIWSAVPNVGSLIATGLSKGPASAVSLAASVGTAYMSYRKQKAENTLAYEREMWQLEKSAIEQFDGLKRELFDTAWRLSKHFGFEDQWRLTERQIHQYNSILMDTDEDRRYSRMEAISDSFFAYPPFWYQYGHTANLIALTARNLIKEKEFELHSMDSERINVTNNDEEEFYKERCIIEQDIKDLQEINKHYCNKAKEHFETYFERNKFGLLREDTIASMCDIEYAELLLRMGEDKYEKDSVLLRLKSALNKAGNSLEIVQLCIFVYMQLDATELAEQYLRILVNEDYNSTVNAQILSSLYVYKIIKNEKGEKTTKAKRDYSILSKRVPSRYLFPMPQIINEDLEILERQFVDTQKFLLLEKYERVLNELIKIYSVKFYQCIPGFGDMKNEEFLFDGEYQNRLMWQLKNKIAREKDKWFVEQLANDDIFVKYMNVIQEYFYKIINLIEQDSNISYGINYEFLMEDILLPLSKENQKTIKEFRDDIQNFKVTCQDILDKLFEKYTFAFFTEAMHNSLADMIAEKINGLEKMNDVSREESRLLQFCNKNGLKLIEEKYQQADNKILEPKSDFLVEQLLGNAAYDELLKKNELRKAILKTIQSYCEKNPLKNRDNKSRMYIQEKDDNELERYFRKIKKKDKSFNVKDVLAVIEEKGTFAFANFTDLWFTTKGLIVVKIDNYNGKCTPYKDVRVEYNGIICGKIKYSNKKDIKTDNLSGLINELKKYSDETDKNAGVTSNLYFNAGKNEDGELCLELIK